MEFLESVKNRFEKYKEFVREQAKMNKMEKKKAERKESRLQMLAERRKISEIFESPAVKPPVKTDRMTKLKQWKKEKEERLKKERQLRKPIFKVGALKNAGFPEVKPDLNTTKVGNYSRTVQKVIKPQKLTASTPLVLPNVEFKFGSDFGGTNMLKGGRNKLTRQNAFNESFGGQNRGKTSTNKISGANKINTKSPGKNRSRLRPAISAVPEVEGKKLGGVKMKLIYGESSDEDKENLQDPSKNTQNLPGRLGTKKLDAQNPTRRKIGVQTRNERREKLIQNGSSEDQSENEDRSRFRASAKRTTKTEDSAKGQSDMGNKSAGRFKKPSERTKRALYSKRTKLSSQSSTTEDEAENQKEKGSRLFSPGKIFGDHQLPVKKERFLQVPSEATAKMGANGRSLKKKNKSGGDFAIESQEGSPRRECSSSETLGGSQIYSGRKTRRMAKDSEERKVPVLKSENGGEIHEEEIINFQSNSSDGQQTATEDKSSSVDPTKRKISGRTKKLTAQNSRIITRAQNSKRRQAEDEEKRGGKSGPELFHNESSGEETAEEVSAVRKSRRRMSVQNSPPEDGKILQKENTQSELFHSESSNEEPTEEKNNSSNVFVGRKTRRVTKNTDPKRKKILAQNLILEDEEKHQERSDIPELFHNESSDDNSTKDRPNFNNTSEKISAVKKTRGTRSTGPKVTKNLFQDMLITTEDEKCSNGEKLNKTPPNFFPNEPNEELQSKSATKSDESFNSSNKIQTSDNNQRPVTYISPFVTTSRGKGSIRKENLERSIRGLPSFTEYSTPDKQSNDAIQASGAAYFHNILNDEISRLQEICKEWNEYKEANGVSEDARDMIDVAVGQASLLISKKFQQFRGLIRSCENGTGEEKPVTCEDLQGFWDMIFIQVENLDKRFGRLTEMKNNNWEEIMPEVPNKVAVKKRPIKKLKRAPSSNLRAAILAARKKQSESQVQKPEPPSEETVFNGVFFTVTSPQNKSLKLRTPNKARNSLRVSVLSTEAKKLTDPCISPGVAMMKASQIAKSVEKSAGFSKTPGKSILKRDKNTSTLNKSKIVLFKESSDQEIDSDFDVPKASIIRQKTPKRIKKSNLHFGSDSDSEREINGSNFGSFELQSPENKKQFPKRTRNAKKWIEDEVQELENFIMTSEETPERRKSIARTENLLNNSNLISLDSSLIQKTPKGSKKPKVLSESNSPKRKVKSTPKRIKKIIPIENGYENPLNDSNSGSVTNSATKRKTPKGRKSIAQIETEINSDLNQFSSPAQKTSKRNRKSHV